MLQIIYLPENVSFYTIGPNSPLLEKFKSMIDLIKTREKKVICTSDLVMATWKPISIEAIKAFLTSLNQLWAQYILFPGSREQNPCKRQC